MDLFWFGWGMRPLDVLGDSFGIGYVAQRIWIVFRGRSLQFHHVVAIPAIRAI